MTFNTSSTSFSLARAFPATDTSAVSTLALGGMQIGEFIGHCDTPSTRGGSVDFFYVDKMHYLLHHAANGRRVLEHPDGVPAVLLEVWSVAEPGGDQDK